MDYKIQTTAQYLCLNYDPDSRKHYLSIERKLPSAISKWGVSTRVSPIWGVSRANQNIEKDSWVVFIGPTAPYELFAESPIADKMVSIWVSIGLRNLILNSSDQKLIQDLTQWLKKNSIPFERFKLTANLELTQPSHHQPRQCNTKTLLNQIAKLTRKSEKLDTDISIAMREYAPLMASSAQRACSTNRELFDHLTGVHQIIEQQIEQQIEQDHSEQAGNQGIYSILTNVNAGLSRYSSQTFSGHFPLMYTECHFWTHSLLGIGTANLALSRLISHISNILGKALIAEKIELLANDTSSRTDFFAQTSAEFWGKKYLDTPGLENNVDDDDLLPSISFFSARDGFRAHELNISAPLTSVSSCSSKKWSLQPITHEISHMIVRSVLSLIFPDNDSNYNDQYAIKLTEDQSSVQNHLDAIRRWQLMAVAIILNPDKNIDNKTLTLEVEGMLSRPEDWKGHVEELMVHVFDFLYFYDDITKYIQSIWNTWSVIPNISDRIPEYILRSLCAITSRDLATSAREDAAINFLRDLLCDMVEQDPTLNYANQAIKYIDENRSNLISNLRVASPLIKFVVKYLHSDTIDGMLHHESRIKGKGYNKRFLKFNGETFDNPLKFINNYSEKTKPKESEAAWIFQTIAFDMRQH